MLYRFSPRIRTEFGRSEEHRWIERYGFVEHTIGKPSDHHDEDGRSSRRRRYRKVVRERPGLAPSALFHLIGNSIFLRLSDVASGLPPYTEEVLVSGMDAEPDSTGLSQRSAYEALFETLRAALADALAKGSRRLLAAYLQTLLAFPDGCTRGEAVFDPETGDDARPGAAPVPRTGSTRRRKPLSTSWPQSGSRAAGCWSTRPIPGRAISPSGWTTSSPGTGYAWRS